MKQKITDKTLEKLYSKYLEEKYLYRAVSKEYISKIMKKGFTPKENPYERMKKDIRRFLSIIENLEKGRNIIYTKWAFEDVPGSRVAQVTRKDLRKNYVDFNPDIEHNKYYLNMQGGALVCNVKHLAKELLKKEELSQNQIRLANKIINFCNKKEKYKMITLKIMADSQYLERAHFQHFTGKYWKSPFGRFENFKKVILQEGWQKYEPYLSGKKRYYLRVNYNIPAGEIEIK